MEAVQPAAQREKKPPDKQSMRQGQIQRGQQVMADNGGVEGLRIIGIDPGKKAPFTAAVHSAAAERHLPRPPGENVVKYPIFSWSKRSTTTNLGSLGASKTRRSGLPTTPTSVISTTQYQLPRLPASRSTSSARQQSWQLFLTSQIST